MQQVTRRKSSVIAQRIRHRAARVQHLFAESKKAPGCWSEVPIHPERIMNRTYSRPRGLPRKFCHAVSAVLATLPAHEIKRALSGSSAQSLHFEIQPLCQSLNY
jgi:hypothetical protein